MSDSKRGRIRKYPVSFGNPALGTYRGNVYTVQKGTKFQPIIENAVVADHVVAMIGVPPDQVPDGILNLIRAHRPWIKHVRIMIAQGQPQEVDQQENNGHAAENLTNGETILGTGSQEEEQSINEGPEPTRAYLVLLELCDEDATNQFIDDLDGKPYTFLDETEVCSLYRVVAHCGEDGVSLVSPFFAPSTKATKEGLEIVPPTSSATIPESNIAVPQHGLSDLNCAVCLEELEPSTTASSSGDEDQRVCVLTTVCNHSFHMDCLLQWQDSPCPVCRYDHSGLNDALSQCHVCGTTEHNFVCLICGAISCGDSARTSAASITRSSAVASSETITDSGNCTSASDLRESSQRLSTSHARRHYNETFHAYALDTETQHVWDFAGQGYVHRLLQNKDDGKLVEVHDLNHVSQERNLSPGLSQEQEDQVVHRKLEGFASQYYTLLKSQLEQQRTFYEGRLEEVRREHNRKPRVRSVDLVNALKHERSQLTRRLDALQAKSKKVKEDVGFLMNMNESLTANKEPINKEIEAVQQERAENERMFSSCLPPLQEKVTSLMLQLEAGFEDKKPSANS